MAVNRREFLNAAVIAGTLKVSLNTVSAEASAEPVAPVKAAVALQAINDAAAELKRLKAAEPREVMFHPFVMHSRYKDEIDRFRLALSCVEQRAREAGHIGLEREARHQGYVCIAGTITHMNCLRTRNPNPRKAGKKFDKLLAVLENYSQNPAARRRAAPNTAHPT